ncbi:hypothetical protein [Actinacidiphila oryziradicis]|uniref:hypothetical protein n=1 Tax=Actinacidiphila oryziradicis TaxID=2571141 RepID=UPI001B808E95|nr:hypothetical protein [Actinacidiphila oryziradicis]
MPQPAASTAVNKTLTSLDLRIEEATGLSTDVLWPHRDQHLLDEPTARLVDAHRKLANAETAVTFYRTLLQRLSSGEYEVDDALFDRIDRTVDQLREAAGKRHAREGAVLAVLEPLEEAVRMRDPARAPDLPAPDFAALVAIAQGAVLRENLLTHRVSVVTTSGTRVPWPAHQRLAERSLVTRDESHPLYAGQPVTLTDAGRACLTGSRRTTATRAARAEACCDAKVPRGPSDSDADRLLTPKGYLGV